MDLTSASQRINIQRPGSADDARLYLQGPVELETCASQEYTTLTLGDNQDSSFPSKVVEMKYGNRVHLYAEKSVLEGIRKLGFQAFTSNIGFDEYAFSEIKLIEYESVIELSSSTYPTPVSLPSDPIIESSAFNGLYTTKMLLRPTMPALSYDTVEQELYHEEPLSGPILIRQKGYAMAFDFVFYARNAQCHTPEREGLPPKYISLTNFGVNTVPTANVSLTFILSALSASISLPIHTYTVDERIAEDDLAYVSQSSEDFFIPNSATSNYGRS